MVRHRVHEIYRRINDKSTLHHEVWLADPPHLLFGSSGFQKTLHALYQVRRERLNN